MLTERDAILISDNGRNFFGRFEALEYVANINKIKEVRSRNKIPIVSRKDIRFNGNKSIQGYDIVNIPDELIGNIELFTEFCHNLQLECGDYQTGILHDTSQERCILCEIANHKGFESLRMYNQFVDKAVDCIIYESQNFYVVPELGALKQGFLMIVPKRHYYSLAQFPKEIMADYNDVCADIEEILLNTFKGNVVVFMEHGSKSAMATRRTSIVHAHIHVVVDFKLSPKYLNMVQAKPCDDIEKAKFKRYFSYQEGTNGQLMIAMNPNVYIQHQFCRQVMAKEMGYAPGQYNWRCYEFDEITDATLFHLCQYLKQQNNPRIHKRTRAFVEGFSKRVKNSV